MKSSGVLLEFDLQTGRCRLSVRHFARRLTHWVCCACVHIRCLRRSWHDQRGPAILHRVPPVAAGAPDPCDWCRKLPAQPAGTAVCCWAGVCNASRIVTPLPHALWYVRTSAQTPLRAFGVLLVNELPGNTNAAGSAQASRPAHRQQEERPKAKIPPAASAQFVHGTVRSGQQVYAEGKSLVILGGVNEGAEVMADGDIHVYGRLQGRAVAGLSGDRSAKVASGWL